MSNQISTAFTKQYESQFQILSQQMMSRFKNKVRRKVAKSGAEYYIDQIDAVSVTEANSQRTAITLGNTPHARREISKRRFYFADTVEDSELTDLLANPTADYTRNALMALERQIDDLIIEAAFADAKTGNIGGTTTTFASEGTTIASGSTGMTFAKLLQIRKTFENDDVPFTKINLAVGPEQEEDLLGFDQFVSTDYRDKSTFDNLSGIDGYVGRFMEFDIWRSTRLAVNTGVRDCVAWVDDGIGLITGVEPKVIISPRVDMVEEPTQIQVVMYGGASRLDGEKVIKVQCQE